MLITSNTLISLASKYSALSSNQAGLTSADFLAIGNLVIIQLVSELLQAREEFLIYEESISVAAGATSVRIPYRAVNAELRHLWWEDGSGARKRLYGRMIEDIENYAVASTSQSPDGFFLMGNNIVLLPGPSVAGSLVVAFPMRPNLLVVDSMVQSSTAIGDTSVTVPNLPTGFVTGALFDIIDHKSGNGILYYDLVGTVAGNVISFPQSIPNCAIGNLVALAGQTSVPNLPEEGHSLLLESVIARIEIIRGNAQRIKNSLTVITDARKAWNQLLLNRVVSKPHSAGSGGPQFPSRPLR